MLLGSWLCGDLPASSPVRMGPQGWGPRGAWFLVVSQNHEGWSLGLPAYPLPGRGVSSPGAMGAPNAACRQLLTQADALVLPAFSS